MTTVEARTSTASVGPASSEPADPRPRRRTTWLVRFQTLLLVSDAAVIVATLLASHAIAETLTSTPPTSGGSTASALTVGAGIAAIWLATLAWSKSRSPRVIAVGTTEYQRVINATLQAFGLTAIAAYLLGLPISRGFFLVALPVGAVGLIAVRALWRRVLGSWRARGRCLNNALVVGRPSDVRRLVPYLRNKRKAGYKVVGFAMTDDDPDEADAEPWEATITSLDESGLIERAHDPNIHAVIIAGDLPGGREQIRRLGWDLEGTGAELILVSRLTDVAGPRIHLRPVEGLPLVHVTLPQYTGIAYALKRALDIVFSITALVLLLPVFAAVALAIKIDDNGPVIFRQTRVGARGRPFTMYKFRSMRTDAEKVLAELMAQNEGAGVLFKMRDDPRVTRVGKVIRALSIDELPQFYNTLNGTMSVVGPRPPLPSEVAEYDADVYRRLLCKPGITGLWQVSGRSNLSWEESVRLDLFYVENWSVTGDLVIIAKTIRSVLAREGAY